jgi:hypothetical protein
MGICQSGWHSYLAVDKEDNIDWFEAHLLRDKASALYFKALSLDREKALTVLNTLSMSIDSTLTVHLNSTDYLERGQENLKQSQEDQKTLDNLWQAYSTSHKARAYFKQALYAALSDSKQTDTTHFVTDLAQFYFEQGNIFFKLFTQAALGSEGVYCLTILLEKARQSYQKAQFFPRKKQKKKLKRLLIMPRVDQLRHGTSSIAHVTYLY